MRHPETSEILSQEQTFHAWFQAETGNTPYPFQVRFACDSPQFRHPSPLVGEGKGERGLRTALKVAAETEHDNKVRKAAKQTLKQQYGNQPPPQQRPRLSLYQGYARPHPEPDDQHTPDTVFNPHMLVVQLQAQQGSCRQLDLTATAALASRWREAILSHSNGLSETVRRILSGHHPNGSAAEGPHLAFMPLAFVGHEQADGHVLGMGVVLPNGISRDERRDALRAIAAVRELKLGPLGVWHIEPVTSSRPAWNLRPETWTAHPQGATHWSTVTPVVFDRHPKAKNKTGYQQETVRMIAEACTRIGLSKPREVIVTQVSAHLGVPPSFAFPRFKRKDGSDRRHTHAILVFNEPVCGPILIGAGRFRGYGVCRAMNKQPM